MINKEKHEHTHTHTHNYNYNWAREEVKETTAKAERSFDIMFSLSILFYSY